MPFGLLSLQDIQHPRSPYPACAEWPRLQHYTCRTYHGKQQMFWSFCAQYHLTAFPALEDMLMVFETYLDDHLQRHYATMHHYMAAIHAAHIALGLATPLEN